MSGAAVEASDSCGGAAWRLMESGAASIVVVRLRMTDRVGSVRRWSIWSGTRHSREAGFRGIRRVYALPISVTMVSMLVKVTL